MRTSPMLLFLLIFPVPFQSLRSLSPVSSDIEDEDDIRSVRASSLSTPAPVISLLAAEAATTPPPPPSPAAGLGNLSQQITTQELLQLQSLIQCQDLASLQPDFGDQSFCNITHDGVSCWPSTPAGTIVRIACPQEFKGVQYDPGNNATRTCHENGTWSEKSNYDPCLAGVIPEKIDENTEFTAKVPHGIFFFGYTLSLAGLTIALWIFLHFKDLRCVRNTIHTNLMFTYVLFDMTWIITATLNAQSSESVNLTHGSCYTSIFMAYFMGTNFSWMFVEGLYLYILVVKTFSIELVNLHHYYLIGYGIPALVVIVWIPIKWNYGTLNPASGLTCVFQGKDDTDFVYAIPFVIVLAVNCFFLGKIMYVLITKLRSATTAESQQYRKAAKALLVLIPLLGLSYLLLISSPEGKLAKIITTYLHAILFSTQGFSVAVLYCFMNGEVQHSVCHRFNRWKTVRALRGGGEYPVTPRTYAFRSTRYGEGVKLYRARPERPRASSASFSTSSTAGVMSHSSGPKKSIGADSTGSRISRGYCVVRRSEDMVF